MVRIKPPKPVVVKITVVSGSGVTAAAGQTVAIVDLDIITAGIPPAHMVKRSPEKCLLHHVFLVCRKPGTPVVVHIVQQGSDSIDRILVIVFESIVGCHCESFFEMSCRICAEKLFAG